MHFVYFILFFDSSNIYALNLQSVLLQAVVIHSGEGNSEKKPEKEAGRAKFSVSVPASSRFLFFEDANPLIRRPITSFDHCTQPSLLISFSVLVWFFLNVETQSPFTATARPEHLPKMILLLYSVSIIL